jgi:DnaJ domain
MLALLMSLISFLFQLAKKLHPDTNKDDKESEQKFQEVNRAYEVQIILSM